MTTSTTNTSVPENTSNPVQAPKTTAKPKNNPAVAKTTTVKPKPTTKAAVKKYVPGISQKVIEELSDEVNNMLSFAVYNGIIVNTEVNTLIQNSNVDDLINAHNLLCKNVAPATPKSIFNKLPLLRNLIFLALFFLIAFIIIGSSPMVDNDSLKKGIMNNQGYSLILNLSYLGAISGLGVLFYLLKEVSTSLKKGTLVPEDSISYVSQILLGIMAGLIMSEILAPYIIDPESKVSMFNKSVLALIGGFSSDAIFSILQGIINKIKSIFITPVT